MNKGRLTVNGTLENGEYFLPAKITLNDVIKGKNKYQCNEDLTKANRNN